MKLSEIPYKRITLNEIREKMEKYIADFKNAKDAKE